MSKKRKRDGTEVDPDLVEVYDQLADEDSSKRINAASKLLTKVYQRDVTTDEQLKAILTRLFRGLCSGRKAARHGFSIALTELMSARNWPRKTAITPAQVVDIFESQTTAEGAASGQDERDHYFGRLFAAQAIMESNVLGWYDVPQWRRLLDSVCSISQKKPWLRQQCGWILYQYASTNAPDFTRSYVEEILKAMTAHKLIRTPEGVAVWIAARKNHWKGDLSPHAWKHKSPLAKKDINSLAEIMKNARSGLDDNQGSQGSAVWSENLHFAWDVLLSDLYFGPSKDGISFEGFWKVAVDEGLFNPSSTSERKSWGIKVWTLAIEKAPIVFLAAIFSRNALHYLITTLHGEDRYLRKACLNVLETLQKRFKTHIAEEQPDARGNCICAIIKNTDFADFDTLTKTKTMATLLDIEEFFGQSEAFSTLNDLGSHLGDVDPKAAHLRRRYILELQAKLVTAALKGEALYSQPKYFSYAQWKIEDWLSLLSQSKDFAPETRTFLIDRIAMAFEQALKYGQKGRNTLTGAMCSTGKRNPVETTFPEFDEDVSDTIKGSISKLKELHELEEKENAEADTEYDTKTPPTILQGLALLYGTLIFEAFCGETQAVEILQELPGDEISHIVAGEMAGSEAAQLYDSIVETLLSLASRSSKILRTVSTLVFESLAPNISGEGISALARVLTSKENAQGQEEIFEATKEDTEESSEESEDEVEELGSDVEMVNGMNGDHLDEEAPSSSSNDSDPSASEEDLSSEADQSPDPELAAFDAALASALGTRKPTEDDDASSSSDDSDMTDSQMLALDAKLSEVFRARAASTSHNSKKTQKQTRETIVNFKNRVLDLVDVYLKQQCTNPLVLELVLPMLEAIRTTQTKQFAERMTAVLREFCGRSKGEKVPVIPQLVGSTAGLLDMLRLVHDEASLESSNAHSAAASQSSLLLVKVLVRSQPESIIIKNIVTIYAETRARQLMSKKCNVQSGFFTDWNNWCASARNTLAI